MIISGANAGGKTIVLKTAGLLSLMAISGLPVPAKEARVPFYRSVLADIGDHNHLGKSFTFSSHMSNIAEMIRECDSPSLVLLDEAGTGTDPEEGSALGVAIVDHFRRACRAQVIASTHYRGLKMYAANDPKCNKRFGRVRRKDTSADISSIAGLAGASSGIEIAHRFGIKDEVIANARENLDSSAQEAEQYLQKLQTETTQAEDLRKLSKRNVTQSRCVTPISTLSSVRKRKARQREFEQQLAQAVEEFDRQSKAFLTSLEDKALKNKLEKERQARKAELNRAVMTKSDAETRTRRGGKGSPPYEGGVAALPPTGWFSLSAVRSLHPSAISAPSRKWTRKSPKSSSAACAFREKVANLRLAEQAETRAVASVPAKNRGISKPVDAPRRRRRTQPHRQNNGRGRLRT